MYPHVVLYNAVSVDGRITGFDIDLGVYYSIVATWKEDATLAGSETMMKALIGSPDDSVCPVPQSGDSSLPLLVMPDSKGRFRHWNFMLSQPYWRGGIALCSRSTPAEYFEHLEQQNVAYFVSGEEFCDIPAAMRWLYDVHGVRTVRADCGGKLNGILLRAGLVSEVNILLHPVLAGSQNPLTLFSDIAGGQNGQISMTLMKYEEITPGCLWLRYAVEQGPEP